MKRTFKALFILSILGLIWWIFLWPGVLRSDQDKIIAMIGGYGTFLLFIVSGVGLLYFKFKAKKKKS